MLHRGLFVSWILVAILASSVFAASTGGPGGGPTPTQNILEYSLLTYFNMHVEAGDSSASVKLESIPASVPVEDGQHVQVPVDFRVTVEVAHQGKNGSSTFGLKSFFDVFASMEPSDPPTGRDGFLAASVSGMVDLGDLRVGDLVIDPCFIVENSFEIQEQVANDVRTFKSRSFHHVLLGATDPAGVVVFDYGAMTDERTTFVSTRAGTSAEIDSFFDVFFDVPSGGGGTSHSFFDISYAVFEPNDEPVLDVDADGHVKAGIHYRPGQGDVIAQLMNRQSEHINVMFNPKEYSLGKSNTWNENEGLSAGTSTVPADTSYHTSFKVKRSAETPAMPPLRREGTLQVVLDFSPPPSGAQPPINLKADAHEVVVLGS